MHARLVQPCEPERSAAGHSDSKQRFRQHFQRSLRACLRRRFSLEEVFEMIFAETLQEIPLGGTEQSELFEELSQWARQRQQLLTDYSTTLFTSFRATDRENP